MYYLPRTGEPEKQGHTNMEKAPKALFPSFPLLGAETAKLREISGTQQAWPRQRWPQGYLPVVGGESGPLLHVRPSNQTRRNPKSMCYQARQAVHPFDRQEELRHAASQSRRESVTAYVKVDKLAKAPLCDPAPPVVRRNDIRKPNKAHANTKGGNKENETQPAFLCPTPLTAEEVWRRSQPKKPLLRDRTQPKCADFPPFEWNNEEDRWHRIRQKQRAAAANRSCRATVYIKAEATKLLSAHTNPDTRDHQAILATPEGVSATNARQRTGNVVSSMVPPSRSQAPHTGTQVSDTPPDAAASSRHEDRAEIDCEMQNSSCASGILHFPPVDGTAAFKNGADGSGADQRNGELCLESDTMKTPGPCVGTGLPGGNEQNLAEGSSAAIVRNGIHRTAEEEIGTLPHLNIRIQELFPELNNPCTAIPEHTPAASCLRPALAAEPDFRRSPSTEFVEDVNPLAGFQGPLFQLFPPLQPWAQTGFPNRHGDCSLQTTNDMSFGEGSYGSDVHIGARAPSEGGIPEALSNKRRLERGYSASISRMEEFDAGVPAFSELSTVHSDSAAVSVVNCPTNDDEGDGIGTRPPGVFQIDRHPEAYVDMESEVSCMGRSSQESAFHNNRRRTAIEFPHGVEEAVTDSRSRYGNPHGDADLPSVAPFGHMPGRWQADPVLDCFSSVSAVNQDGAAARCVRSLASPCERAKKFNESGPQHHGASAVAAQAAAIASAPYAMRYMALFDLLLHQRDLDYNSSRPREYVEKRDEQRYPLTATSAAAVASAPYAERCSILYEVLEQQAPVAEYSVSSVAHPPFRSVPPGLRNPSHEPHRGLPYGSPSPFPSAVLVDYSSDPHAPLRRKSSPFCEPPAFPLLPAAGGAFHLPAPYGPSWQPSEPSSSSATFSHSFEASQHQAQNPFGVSTAAARAPPNQDIPFLPFSATRRPL